MGPDLFLSLSTDVTAIEGEDADHARIGPTIQTSASPAFSNDEENAVKMHPFSRSRKGKALPWPAVALGGQVGAMERILIGWRATSSLLI